MFCISYDFVWIKYIVMKIFPIQASFAFQNSKNISIFCNADFQSVMQLEIMCAQCSLEHFSLFTWKDID